MPLPTLLTKGAITTTDKLEQSEADRLTAIDYITAWLSKRVTGGTTPATIIPSRGGDRILLLESKTGSGKSTTLPPSVYISFGKRKSVCVTQPRVISAVQTPSDIVNHYPELKLEENIGYQTGGISRRVRSGVIFMTIGVLYQQLKTLEDEKILKKYKFIIIDEVHDRSVDLDMTMSLLKGLLNRNYKSPDCPFVILTSATFDIESLRIYFGAPKSHIIKVAGSRAFEIEEHFLEVATDNYVEKAISLCMDLHTQNSEDYRHFVDEVGKGRPPKKSPAVDILVFVSGVGDLDKMVDELNKNADDEDYPFLALRLNSKIYSSAGIEYKSILSVPLHKLKTSNGRMPVRRIIVSTDVAETSVTIETLKYCIDTGIKNFVFWNPDYNSNCSLISHIPQSSATQRKGRVGRVSPGKWYPCYTKEVFDMMPKNTYPDIITANMTSGLLAYIVLNEGMVVSEMDFVTNIPSSSLGSALEELYLLGAITKDEGKGEKIIPTTIGKVIKDFPILRPNLVRLILAGYEHGVNIKLLITLACLINAGSKVYKTKYKLQDLMPELGTQHLVMGDDFIDSLILFQNFTSFISKAYGGKVSLNSISEWSAKAGLNLGNEFLGAIELRDRIILAVYELGLGFNSNFADEILIPGLNPTLEQISKFDEQVIAIKKCIRDAFIAYRLDYTGRGKIYKSYIKGINVTIGGNVMKYLYSVIPDSMPKVIYTSGVKFGKNKYGDRYEFANEGGISVMDGFCEVDDNYY